MGKFIDYVVKYDPKTETAEDLTRKIIYSLIVRRNKGNKPTTIFLGGDSGEGKSTAGIRLQEILMELKGLSIKEHFDAMNVYTPLEYPSKIDRLLHSEDLKKVNIICIHEAREIIRAKKWQDFLTQAVADVNAMSRSIKRITFIIISQFIRDITTDIRYTLNYYVTAYRPIGKKCRLKWSVMWKDDRDVESPRLNKRGIRGYLVYPNGRYVFHQPTYMEVSLPDKELIKHFEKKDYEAKAAIIRRKLEQMLKEMQVGIEDQDSKIHAMTEWYLNNPESLNLISKSYRGKLKIKPEIKVMHDLTDTQVKQFEEKLNEKFKEKGMV